MTVPIFLDFITVFCLVAGSLLLWLNFRRYGSDVILTKVDSFDPGMAALIDPEYVPEQDVVFERLQHHVSEETIAPLPSTKQRMQIGSRRE
jgi:hypothetical protein